MEKKANQVFIDDDLIERLLRGEKPNMAPPSAAETPQPETTEHAATEYGATEHAGGEQPAAEQTASEQTAPAAAAEQPAPEAALQAASENPPVAATSASDEQATGRGAGEERVDVPVVETAADSAAEIQAASDPAIESADESGNEHHAATGTVESERALEHASETDHPEPTPAASSETSEALEISEVRGTATAELAPEAAAIEQEPAAETNARAEAPHVSPETFETNEHGPVPAQAPAEEPPAPQPISSEPEATALRELAERVSAEEFPKDENTAPVAPRRRASFAGLFAKAVSLASQGRLDDAIAALEGSVAAGAAAGEDAQDSADVHAGLGHLRFEQHNWAEAAQHYHAVAKAEPAHPTAHYNLALALERQGKFQEAAEAFADALRIDSGRWQAQLGRGLCLLRTAGLPRSADAKNSAAEALACFEAVDAIGHGDSAAAIFGKAAALQQLGRLEEAHTLYQTLLPAHPEAHELVVNLLSIAAAHQDWAQAEELAHKLAVLDPHSVLVLQVLAAVEAARGNHATAVEHGRALVEKVPDSYDGWFNLGLAQHALGEFAGARDAYQQAVRVYEHGLAEKITGHHAAEAYANLGSALQELGDHAEAGAAGAAFNRALELRPDMLGALWNLGLLSAREGDAHEAERWFERVAAIRSDWEDVAFRLGVLQFARADYGSAAGSFETFLTHHPDWTDPRVDLALCQWKLGQVEQAGANLALVIEHDAEHKGALHCLAALSLENVNAQDGEPASAAVLELYRKVVALGLASPELSFNAGVLLQAGGDAAAAQPCFEDAIARKPEFAAALLNLGHIFQKNGAASQARALWAQAILAEPEFAAGYFN